MEEVLLEKEVRRVSIDDVLLTLLEMVDPVTTRIPQFGWQAASNGPFVNLSPEYP
jgi:hypothetical protein